MNPLFVIYRRDIISYSSMPITSLLCFKIIDNRLVLDEKRRLPGRSFYIKKDKESLTTFITSKKFSKYQKLSNATKLITSIINKMEK